MRKNGLIGLVAVTALAAAGALWPAATPGTVGQVAGGEIVLPGFADHPDAAATIEFSGGTGQVTLQRQTGQRQTGQRGAADAWTVAEKDFYPADPAKIHNALLGLARLRLVEPKTRRSELFRRLAVEDPGADAKSVLVRVRDATGKNLGEVIVGRKKPDPLGSGNDGTYVRRPDAAQAWLAEGSPDASVVALDWLDKSVAALPPARFRRIVTAQPDGARLELVRSRPEDEFVLPDAPADAKYFHPYKRTDLAGLLNGLEFSDVKAAAGVPLPADRTVRAEFSGFDGLVVTASLAELDGVQWIKISAVATDAAARAEARRLDAAWSRWLYAIPDFRANALRIKRSDILDAPKAP
jgi:hypothetical protein